MTTRLDFATLDLMDALDLAVLIENEAFERYQMFAKQLGHRGPGDAGSIFVTMAENEAKHGKELAERRLARFGKTPMRVSPDDILDVEAPEQGAPSVDMSARQALEVALSAEQKALQFYNQALTKVADDEIQGLFTELRDEEVEHVRMVQSALADLPASADVPWDDDKDEYPAL